MNTTGEIVVVGAGAAGIAAAVGAARAGRRVLLLDSQLGVGGTGGHSGLTTLCGLFDERGNQLNDGFAREFAGAVAETRPLRMGRVYVLPYRPAKFRETAEKFLKAEALIEAQVGTPVSEVKVQNGRIVKVNGRKIGAVIDCSGTAEIGAMAGAELLATDESTQAPAVIFSLENVDRGFSEPAEAAKVLLPLARAGFAPLTFLPELEKRVVTIKFTGPIEQAREVAEWLRRKVEGFGDAVVRGGEFKAARRAGRMIIGRHLLTGEEALTGKKFSDAAARCAWPIEQWGADGVVRFRYLPAGEFYEIPKGSLQSRQFENLFMGGKTISADADAMGSARVMGCCLATGAAAGQLAAEWLGLENL